ncbi:long-chain-fatty-acid--CoA ligase [Stackebrandtia nassauensis]|uniref:AMP-dependent synthetase and ligase n=1 Tax=Stackebrandtia nassauensis (strain DSM 44728 / CIP 108903 / NRRL B-16338 / NBRC 102104 / LLR-40K-21) TaxID=446470 RepID=D3Q3I0_STANL|nr:long-chain fatty acid--CoA ligase [Stackebrandtia nassauensis]ADD42021.1 AMP-dependent synthetase and ligase [Stackebrandtia nassauensis DSM 44728]
MSTLSLASVLAGSARRCGDHIGLIEGDKRITYSRLWAEALAQAAALERLGVRPGDRVALMCPNTVEFPRAYYAILAAGAVVVPVHLLLRAEETEYVLRDSGARLLLCHSACAEVGGQAARAAGVRMVTVGPQAPDLGADAHLEDVAEAGSPLPTFVTRAPGDPAVVFYTSGTSGQSKGAVLSHLNLIMNATICAFDTHDYRRDDIALGALPLFHTFGQSVSMNTLFRLGGTLVLMPRFDPAAAIELMVAENVTVFHGVPTMYRALTQAAAHASALPRLRLCLSGGASLPGPVLEEFNTTFDASIYEGYGLSETSPVATVNQPAYGTRVGTVGHPLWGVDVEIARAESEGIELLPTGELGEIVVRGHNVFNGYLDRPAESAKALVDDWFRTGDLGTKDDEGFVTIVDRVKDMIIRNGFNVYPSEVEEVLLRHPGVAEVAVIGLPDEECGEEVCAVVVADEDQVPTAEEVLEFGRERMGAHKYPRRVEFVKELPLGPSMKVLKRVLRDRFS